MELCHGSIDVKPKVWTGGAFGLDNGAPEAMEPKTICGYISDCYRSDNVKSLSLTFVSMICYQTNSANAIHSVDVRRNCQQSLGCSVLEFGQNP